LQISIFGRFDEWKCNATESIRNARASVAEAEFNAVLRSLRRAERNFNRGGKRLVSERGRNSLIGDVADLYAATIGSKSYGIYFR